MDKFIYRMEVRKSILSARIDWLGDYDESLLDDDFEGEEYELFFPTFEEMSAKLDEITTGYYQFWADARDDRYGNNVERLEYHNGSPIWDSEINVESSRLYLSESLLKSIDEVRKG